MTQPLISYAALFWAAKWIFGFFIASGILALLIGPMLKGRSKGMYIDAEPFKDSRDSQRRDEEFRKQNPSRFT